MSRVPEDGMRDAAGAAARPDVVVPEGDGAVGGAGRTMQLFSQREAGLYLQRRDVQFHLASDDRKALNSLRIDNRSDRAFICCGASRASEKHVENDVSCFRIVLSLVLAWFSRTRVHVRRYNQAMAECRRLKRAISALLRQHEQNEELMMRESNEWRRKLDESAMENIHLDAIIAEQERELKARQLQIDRLQAELDVAKTTIDRLVAVRTCETTSLQMMTAQHIAAMTKATSGHPQNGIGDLL